MSVTSMITYRGGGKDFGLTPKYPSLLDSISGPCNGLLFQALCGTHSATATPFIPFIILFTQKATLSGPGW